MYGVLAVFQIAFTQEALNHSLVWDITLGSQGVHALLVHTQTLAWRSHIEWEEEWPVSRKTWPTTNYCVTVGKSFYFSKVLFSGGTPLTLVLLPVTYNKWVLRIEVSRGAWVA